MTIKIDCDSELFKALLALSVDLILTNAREKKNYALLNLRYTSFRHYYTITEQ